MSLAGWESNLQFGLIYALFALSVYAVLSTGLLSLASIVSGLIAGFGFGYAAMHSGLSAIVILLLGIAAGGLFGYLLSFLFVRLSGHYLAMGSITLILIFNVLVINLPGLTGGVVGEPVPGSYGWAYLLVTVAVFCWIFLRLRGSRLGLAAAVVREDPLVAAGVGINPRSVQRLGFFLAGLSAGAGGVLLASELAYISSDSFYLNLAFVSLASVVLGSAYRWQGALLGGIVFTALPDFLSNTVPQTTVQIIYGFAIVVIMIFMPEGLYDPQRWKRGVLRLTGRSTGVSAPAERAGASAARGGAVPEREDAQPTASDRVAASEKPPPGEVVMQTVGLTKTFGGLNAVDDFSVQVTAGEIFGILGPNGAGKTTVINLLSGVFAPDHGEVLFLGSDVTRMPSHQRAANGLARTYQNIRLSPGLTTLETITSGSFVHGKAGLLSIVGALPSERRERQRLAEQARELMDTVGLTVEPERLAETLSYGDQRRVEIARALASRPRVLLLDEPTAGMNYSEATDVGDLLRNIRADGTTVILIEHNMRLVAEYCDRCVVMQSGCLLAEGAPSDCLEREDVQQAYFGRRGDAERLQALRLLRAD